MKICTFCKKEKPLSDFNKNKTRKDGYSTSCRNCINEYNRKNYKKYLPTIRAYNNKRKKETRKWFQEYKLHLKCEECGYNKHPAALDFHHLDPNTKENAVRHFTNGYAKERILAEIAKCKVLCANCHRIHHYMDPESDGKTLAS